MGPDRPIEQGQSSGAGLVEWDQWSRTSRVGPDRRIEQGQSSGAGLVEWGQWSRTSRVGPVEAASRTRPVKKTSRAGQWSKASTGASGGGQVEPGLLRKAVERRAVPVVQI